MIERACNKSAAAAARVVMTSVRALLNAVLVVSTLSVVVQFIYVYVHGRSHPLHRTAVRRLTAASSKRAVERSSQNLPVTVDSGTQ